MIAKWFLLLNKIVNAFKTKVLSFFDDNVYLLSTKMLWSVIGISLTPPFLVFLYFYFLLRQESVLDEKIHALEKKAKSLVAFKNEQDRFIREFGSSDLAFLQKYVERIELLKDEVDFLSKINSQVGYEPVQKRLKFLTSGENSIRFVLKNKRKSNVYAESEWILDHIVEVENKDVLQIVSLLEGVKLSNFNPNPLRPQFIIKNFSLQAKEGMQDEVFYLNLEILQRSLYEKN
jgi:hypothetical protein